MPASSTWTVEEKQDGLRCIVYHDPQQGTDLRNKRNKALLPCIKEASTIPVNAAVSGSRSTGT